MSEEAATEDVPPEEASTEDTSPEDAVPEGAVTEDTSPEDAVPEDAAPEDAAPKADRGPRGRIWLYAIAFVLVLVSAYAQYKGNLLSSLRFVWWSIGLSGLAVAVAATSVLVPGPKRLPTAEPTAEEKETVDAPS